MKTQFTNDQINAVMEKRDCTRKAALRWLNRNREDRPKGKAAAAPAKVDGKQAAANDRPEATPAPMTSEERGKARAEGLRLYKLAGRPTKAQFIKVYGKRGHLMTWDQRAEAGVSAAKFQATLAEKQGK
jgi:hypothetical protein